MVRGWRCSRVDSSSRDRAQSTPDVERVLKRLFLEGNLCPTVLEDRTGLATRSADFLAEVKRKRNEKDVFSRTLRVGVCFKPKKPPVLGCGFWSKSPKSASRRQPLGFLESKDLRTKGLKRIGLGAKSRSNCKHSGLIGQSRTFRCSGQGWCNHLNLPLKLQGLDLDSKPETLLTDVSSASPMWNSHTFTGPQRLNRAAMCSANGCYWRTCLLFPI